MLSASSCLHSLAGSFDFLPLGFPVSFPSLLLLGSACALSSCQFSFLPRRSLASVRSALSFLPFAMPAMCLSGLFLVGRFPWLVRCWLLRVPWSPSFSSVFLYGFLWPSRSPAGPCLPFTYAIWVLCPVESSPSACVSPLWLFLFSHRVVVLWFLLSLQALVSQPTLACMSRVCSLSCHSTFFGCSVPPDDLFLLLGVLYPYGVGSCSFLPLLSRV